MERNLRVLELPSEAWSELSEDAHRAVFGKIKSKDFDRIDYALLVTQGEKPVGYVTVREIDHETVYWQFGGGFEWGRNSATMISGYDALLDHQLRKSKRITTFVESTNYPMLKIHLSRKWQIIGTRHYQNSTLVELLKEKNDE